MSGIDRNAAYNLLQTGAVVEFQVVRTQIHEGPDAAEFSAAIDLEFPAKETLIYLPYLMQNRA